MVGLLPILSTIVMFIFVVVVFQRWLGRKRSALLFWGIGLTMFGIGSFAEAYSAFAWSSPVFRSWYAFGAMLNAAWIGMGTMYLLARPKFAHGVLATLVILSLIGLFGMPFFDLQGVLNIPINGSGFDTSLPLSDQYREVLPEGAWFRLMTPIFNIFGLLALVGGAIYSAWLFWRKKTLLSRMWGNILIAAGALIIGFASSLTRMGIGDFLYLGEFISAVLMFSGFLVATQRIAEEEPQTATARQVQSA